MEINRCQEKMFFLTLVFFKIMLTIIYLYQCFFFFYFKCESLFASWFTHQKET